MHENDIYEPMIPSTQGEAEKSFQKILCEALRIIGPYSVNGVLLNGSVFLRTLILSRLGTNTLAAAALVGSTELLTLSTAKEFLVSTGAVVARNADSKNTMGIVLQQSLLFATLQTIFVIPIFLTSNKIFRAIGQDAEISEIAGDYLMKLSAAVPAMLWLRSIEMFMLAVKQPTLVLFTNALNTFSTLALTYAFALGHAGFPELGFSGSAYAAILSTWICLLGALLLLRCHPAFKEYNVLHFAAHNQNRKEILKTLFFVGLPIGTQFGIEFSYNFLRTVFAGRFGKNSLVAEQIMKQYTQILLSTTPAITTANEVLIGREIADNNAIDVKKIGMIGVTTSLVIPAAGFLIFCFAQEPLVQIFVKPTNVNYQNIVNIMQWLFVISGINNLMYASEQSSAGVLRGFYDTAIPTALMMSCLLLIGLPVSALMAFTLQLGIWGLYMGRGASLLVATPMLLKRCQNSLNNPVQSLADTQLGFKHNVYKLFQGLPGCGVSRTRRSFELDNTEGSTMTLVTE